MFAPSRKMSYGPVFARNALNARKFSTRSSFVLRVSTADAALRDARERISDSTSDASSCFAASDNGSLRSCLPHTSQHPEARITHGFSTQLG